MESAALSTWRRAQRQSSGDSDRKRGEGEGNGGDKDDLCMIAVEVRAEYQGRQREE